MWNAGRVSRAAATFGIAASLMVAAALWHGTARAAGVKAGGKRMKHLLVVTVTKGFRHDSIPVAEETIEALGKQTGDWDTDFVRTDDEMQQKMTPAALQHYDAVVFANTTGVLPVPDPNAFLAYIREGHGFAAMHSGSDTFHTWPGQTSGVSEYAQMLGGEFETHHSQCAVNAELKDPHFPADAPIAEAARKAGEAAPEGDEQLQQRSQAMMTPQGPVWRVFDEIYLFKNNDPSKVHVLLALDHHPNDGSPEANQPGTYLLSWDKMYGRGRVFYTALGHRQEVWRDPLYRQHILGGIRFVLGEARGSTKLGQE